MQELRLTLPIRCKGTIFDVETTGLAPSIGELITIGYVSGSKLRIIQRDDRNGSEKNRISEIAESLTVLPHPYMAYNKIFEQRWLPFEIDIDLWENWKRLATEVGAKYPKLKELVPPLLNYFGITRGEIPSLWKKYVEEGDKDALVEIVAHNLDDLIRSHYLYVCNEILFTRKEKKMKRI